MPRNLSYGTYAELLYCMPAAGAPYANSNVRTIVSANTSTNPAFKLPAGFFNPSFPAGQAIRVVARGTYSTTGTPTLQIQCALDTTQGTFGTLWAGTGAYTAETGVTNSLFELEFDAVCNAAGTSGTLQTIGSLTHQGAGGAGGNAATSDALTLMVGVGSAPVTINTTVDNYLELWATWGTASASNTLTLTQLMVFGLN